MPINWTSSGGRKIAEWEYTDDRTKEEYKVQARYHYEYEKTYFVVFGRKVKTLQGSDIHQLRMEFEAACREHSGMRMVKMLRVDVRTDQDNMELGVSYEIIYAGKYKNEVIGWYDEEKKNSWGKPHGVILPWTQQRQDALDEIQRRLSVLAAEVQTVLEVSPKKLKEVLDLANVPILLPANTE